MARLSAAALHALYARGILPAAHLVTVADGALAGAPDLGQGTRLRLETAVHYGVSLPDYDDPWLAPRDVLAPALARAALDRPPLLHAVVRAWARARGDLRATVDAYLERPEVQEAAWDGRDVSHWTAETLWGAVGAIRRRQPHLGRDDVALMLFWRSARPPAPPRAEEPPLPSPAPDEAWGEGGQGSGGRPPAGEDWPTPVSWRERFDLLLRALSAEPADSPAWEEAHRLVEGIQRLRAEYRGAEVAPPAPEPAAAPRTAEEPAAGEPAVPEVPQVPPAPSAAPTPRPGADQPAGERQSPGERQSAGAGYITGANLPRWEPLSARSVPEDDPEGLKDALRRVSRWLGRQGE